MLGEGAFELCLSVPLFTEYEAKVLEQLSELNIDEQDVEQLLDYLVSQARLQEVFYLWRPILQDPKDDMVLEAAVAADVKYLVTHNIRDFTQAKTFAVRVVTPGSFLKEILI